MGAVRLQTDIRLLLALHGYAGNSRGELVGDVDVSDLRIAQVGYLQEVLGLVGGRGGLEITLKMDLNCSSVRTPRHHQRIVVFYWIERDSVES